MRYSLRKIEDYIRDELNPPRKHFALNCASRICPLLKDGTYSDENFDQELGSTFEVWGDTEIDFVTRDMVNDDRPVFIFQKKYNGTYH